MIEAIEPFWLSSTRLLFDCVKSNSEFRLPSCASNDASPMRPVNQLSSMNFVIEACSVAVWSTKFVFAYGEMTSSGSRGPGPQRSW